MNDISPVEKEGLKKNDHAKPPKRIDLGATCGLLPIREYVNFVCKINCDHCEIILSDAQLIKMVENELKDKMLTKKQKDRNTYKSIKSLIDSEPTSLDR